MKKRGKSVKVISLFQIILLVSFVFAFSFILNSNFVSASGHGCGFNEWSDDEGNCVPCGNNQVVSDDGLGCVNKPGTTGDPQTSTTGVPAYTFGTPSSTSSTSSQETGDPNVGGETPEDVGFFDGKFIAPIVENFKHAALIIVAIQLLGPLFGLSGENTNALSQAVSAGFLAAGIAEGLSDAFGGKILEFLGANAGLWAGLGVGVLVLILTYKKEKQETVVFSCLPWQAPTGGSECEKCNNKDFPCSEYQCRSLGQACELVNKGTNEENCVWVNRNDVNPPIIQPWEDALLNDYRYAPDNAVSPPDRGVKILYENSVDNCVPAFTPLKFGVTLNEPATCKLDILRKDNFDNMALFMSSGLARYNHSYALSLPSAEALASENISIQNDGNFELYTRCRDANGNSNTATFQFRYCVDQGPDTTPPLIVATSLINNAPIAFNQSSVDLEVYVNEPADCRWDHNDRAYESMEQSMECSTNILEYNSQSLYKCSTTLTGLNDRVENKFYFRCKDKPNSPDSDRNVNLESYEFSIIGTQPLVIDSVEPDNELIKDSTSPIKVELKVETSQGYDEGRAFCYFSDTGESDDYIKFLNTDSHRHSQELFLLEGDYDYFVRCIDLGGNADTKEINFTVETDLTAPVVVRAYKEDNLLRLITNEKAECVYSTFGCNYEFTEGTEISVINDNNHFTSWSSNLHLYVKCQDNFGNRPLPNQCNIVVKASDFIKTL